MTFYPQPKPRPKALDKQDDAADVRAQDRAERAKCKARSGGRCEVVVQYFGGPSLHASRILWERRCDRRTSENHHLMGGIGRRNVGPSMLAEHRIEVCSICHSEVTKHILQPVGVGREDAKTVRYERIR